MIDWVSVEELDWSAETSAVTLNADLEPKTHHQTPMTCTNEYSHFRHFQNGNAIFKYMNYVSIFVATVLEVPFSVLKKGVSQYFCPYSVYKSLVFGDEFLQTSQILPNWFNQSFLF